MKNVDLSDPEIQKTWDMLTNNNNDVNYMVLGFEGKKVIRVIASGEGGLDDLRSHMDPSEVMFAVMKIEALDKKKNVTSRRRKYVFFTWIGPDVGVMKKARVSIQGSDILGFFGGISMTLDVYEEEDLDPRAIAKTMLKIGGAHMPTHFLIGGEEYAVTDLA